MPGFLLNVRRYCCVLALSLGATLTGSFVVAPAPALAAEADASAKRVQQRKDYAAARRALDQKQLQAYRQLLPKLSNYPLLPYLEYDEVNRRLASFPVKDVTAFLTKYPDSLLADRLSRGWLKTLASHGRWQLYNDFYSAGFNRDPELACHSLYARLKTGDETALDEVAELWNIGKSQHKACDPVFAAWSAAGRQTQRLIEVRHMKALAGGNRALANYLARQLNPQNQPLAKLLQEVDENPRILARKSRFAAQTPRMREILLYGLQKLSRQDAMQALTLWQGYDAQQMFTDEERLDIRYYLASRLMRQRHPDQAEQLLASISEITRVDLVEWLIRDALRKQDWEKSFEWLSRLPEESLATERWSYWQARIMEELKIREMNGRTPADLYAQVAATRSFYGFLSADKLGFEYGLVDKPMAISEDIMRRVENAPGVQRAREFYVVGDMLAANREWYHTLRQMTQEEKVAAGRIANVWGWHRHGIQAMIEAQHWDDLKVRFPIAYQEHIDKAASATSINPLLLYSIARQESSFMVDARSPVGATGLMQLMPATAKQTAQRAGMTFTPQDLLKPDKNIALGSRYLNQLLQQFNGNRILAAAAYNAGPSRVKQWLSKDEMKLPYDVWIETIPFQETRGYVQNVLSFSVIYAYRTGQKQPVITREEANSAL